MLRNCIFVFAVVLSASPLIAGTTGILEGKVVDKETKEPLIGVSVAIVGTPTGAATNEVGFFQINNLQAGTYDVRFSNIGYQTLVCKNVDVHPDLRTKISIELGQSAVQLGEIEVTAERPLIEKDITSTNFSVNAAQVDRLPIRNVQDILALFPSVTAEGNVRGGKTSEVVYLVDGLPLQDVIGGGIGTPLPKSSITEFSIQSGGFEAEFGNALSGIVNIVTRRGSDKHSITVRMEKDDWIAGSVNRQHNRFTETELTLSGPLVHGKLYYFSANTFQLTDTRWWQDFDNFFASPISREFSGFGKLDFVVSSRMRITGQSVYSLHDWHDYEYSWRFNLDGLPKRNRSSYRTTAILSHTVTDNIYYALSLSHYYLHSMIGEDDKSSIPLTPYEYDFFLEYVVKGSRAWWSDTKQKVYTGKGDLTIQPNPRNVLKFGFEVNQYDIFNDLVKYEPQRTYFGKILPDEPLLNYSSSYHYYPRSGSVYLQDKLEVEADGAVVNLGFRWDFLDPRSERPVVEYVTPDSSSGQYQSQVTRFVPASLKQQISPRMGLSFPLMWNMVLVMNYGHYFQFPLFDYLYSGTNPQQIRSGVNVLVGNPDLKPERTHAWEVGVKYGLDEKTALHVTYFKKEFIDEIDSKTFLPSKARVAGDYGFAEYVNNAFANAEGLEFIVSRNRDERFSGSISYSLMRTEGVSDYVNQGINLQQWGFPVLNEPYPLSWDQLHTLKISVDARLPWDLVCNAVWTYSSGKPYTYFPTRDGFTADDTTRAFLPNNARLPSNNTLNVKASKKFLLGGLASFSVYADARNLFNTLNPRWADANGRIGGQLADPSAYYDPRRVSFGVRYDM
ncbi:MAG: TonB-dependent receptor [Ignavibacteriae bacterium]|nr:TonB-dependent receptor [Ignavibacteria bacterium]MBI3364961.1 TonB-dependent receptor [Ignavibacteriota bacterium]